MDTTVKFGKYEILSVLGEGGMGVVYKARDPMLDRCVAIKTIRRSLLKGKSGEQLRKRFRREAQAEGRLVHPNIIAIYEYQEDSRGTPFFVMECVEGSSLKEFIARGMHFNLDTSVVILKQVLSALSYSHGMGVIHRDIKPANIILLEDGSIKIADFGISKIEGTDFTQSGQIMGTPQYVSPEQRLGQRTDQRSDLYSAGAVFYELLTGIKAFSGGDFGGKSPTAADGQPSKLDTNDPATMRIYKQVVLKALKPDPKDRFRDADEFASAIQRAMGMPASDSRGRNFWLWAGGALGVFALFAAVYFTQPASNDSKPIITRAPLTTAERQKIEQHLKVAQTHALIGRLLLPDGSSAYHSYEMVLEIDPQNTAALAGIAELRARVIQDVRKSLESGQLEKAKYQLDIALTRFPDDDKLASLQTKITPQP